MLDQKTGFFAHFTDNRIEHGLPRLHMPTGEYNAAADLVLHKDPAAVADHAEVGKLNKACTAHVFASPRSRIVINSSPVIVSFS